MGEDASDSSSDQLPLQLNNDSPVQLVFDLPVREAFDRDDFFVSPSNEHAVQMIDLWPDWPSKTLFIVGPAGCGKSHLAEVWRSRSGAQIHLAAEITASGLPDLEAGSCHVIEDIDRGQLDETALFHLLNLGKEYDLDLMITAKSLPGTWDIKLPDLRSRLRSIPYVSIEPPDDLLLRATLVKLFSDRQLEISPEIVNYLALHIDRTMSAVREAVEKLDRTALAKKRRITRNLVREILKPDN